MKRVNKGLTLVTASVLPAGALTATALTANAEQIAAPAGPAAPTRSAVTLAGPAATTEKLNRGLVAIRAESWSNAVGGLRSTTGANIGRKPSSANFVIRWDGDAQRELLDGTRIDKYGTGGDTRLLTASGVHADNGTKATPSVQADILGDWREEVIWPTTDNRALRIYSTTDPTSITRPSLMQDRMYRNAVAWQNTAYNQPPHPSFAIG